MSGYNFTIKEKANDWEISIDPVAEYGFFEFVGDDENRYVEGGMWFFTNEHNKLELADHDGTAVLPKNVSTMLRKAGIVVGKDFD